MKMYEHECDTCGAVVWLTFLQSLIAQLGRCGLGLEGKGCEGKLIRTGNKRPQTPEDDNDFY